jgi:Flp pilus assembly protein TadG
MPFRSTLGPPAGRCHCRPPVTGLVRAPRGLAAGGQAAVELVAVLPLVLALSAGLWQLAVFAHTAWSASSAAHAAARAEAIGLSPGRAARAHLPARLERGLRLRASADGRVRVTVRVPSSFGLRLGTTSAVARFTPQR